MVAFRKIILYNGVMESWTISGAHESQVNNLSWERMATCKFMMPNSKADCAEDTFWLWEKDILPCCEANAVRCPTKAKDSQREKPWRQRHKRCLPRDEDVKDKWDVFLMPTERHPRCTTDAEVSLTTDALPPHFYLLHKNLLTWGDTLVMHPELRLTPNYTSVSLF